MCVVGESDKQGVSFCPHFSDRVVVCGCGRLSNLGIIKETETNRLPLRRPLFSGCSLVHHTVNLVKGVVCFCYKLKKPKSVLMETLETMKKKEATKDRIKTDKIVAYVDEPRIISLLDVVQD